MGASALKALLHGRATRSEATASPETGHLLVLTAGIDQNGRGGPGSVSRGALSLLPPDVTSQLSTQMQVDRAALARSILSEFDLLPSVRYLPSLAFSPKEQLQPMCGRHMRVAAAPSAFLASLRRIMRVAGRSLGKRTKFLASRRLLHFLTNTLSSSQHITCISTHTTNASRSSAVWRPLAFDTTDPAVLTRNLCRPSRRLTPTGATEEKR